MCVKNACGFLHENVCVCLFVVACFNVLEKRNTIDCQMRKKHNLRLYVQNMKITTMVPNEGS